MTHLDTLVNGGLIVHWPLAGKMHGDAWAAEPARQTQEVLRPCLVLGSV